MEREMFKTDDLGTVMEELKGFHVVSVEELVGMPPGEDCGEISGVQIKFMMNVKNGYIRRNIQVWENGAVYSSEAVVKEFINE